MATNLIGSDIKLMRKRYDEALAQQGIPCIYQFPNLADSNEQGEPVIDSYSQEIETNVFFDGSPKVTTFKRYGWVVENNQDMPFLIHCSFSLPNVQKDSLFRISGMYTDVPERVFRVTKLTYDLQAPDHIICQIVPNYETRPVGRTNKEIEMTFDKSSHFIKNRDDYSGMPYSTKEEVT